MQLKSDTQIGIFLTGLHERRGRGQLADAAQTIKESRKEIDRYIDDRRWIHEPEARHYKGLVEKFENGPKNTIVTEATYSIRTFRQAEDQTYSCTFPTQHRGMKIAGWVLAAALIGATLYLGHQTAKHLGYFFQERTHTIDNLIENK